MAAAIALIAVGGPIWGVSTTPSSGPAAGADTIPRWVAAWAAVPVGAADGRYPFLPDGSADQQTFREIARPAVGGRALRAVFSNRYGTAPLHIGRASVAQRAYGPVIVGSTARTITFAGRPSVVVPPGSDITSDPVVFRAAAGTDVAVSFAVLGQAGRASWHAGTPTTSYATVPGAGDHVGDTGGDAFDRQFHSVLWLTRLEVETVAPGTVIALGDSLTDGYGLSPDSNARWTDALGDRLALAGGSSALAVVNAGASGNKVTAPTTCDESCVAGPALLTRAGPDALDVAGVAGVVIMEGTNDVVAGVPAPAIEADLLAVIAHAHRRGVPVVLVTVPPGNFSPDREQDRLELNAWVRQQAPVEHVVDADVLLHQPGSPSRLDALYDIGDGIHLTPAAQRVLANAFDPHWFARPANARRAAAAPRAVPPRASLGPR